MKSFLMIFLWGLVLFSCTDSKKKEVTALLQEWEGKRIVFPSNPIFTIQGEDTVEYCIQDTYKILTYIDSTGCTSCKLRFAEWRKFIGTVDSIQPRTVQFLFFLCPKAGTEIYQTLRVDRFKFPICIDEEDSLNRLNHFPSETAFQTFLLDKSNKVLAIGNPVHNPKVKELYLKIIKGEAMGQENTNKQTTTKVSIDRTSVSLGGFDWQEEQKATFILKNTGDKLLVIQDIVTSCGCTTVSYSKEPVQPGKGTTLEVAYKAELPEHFAKTITVYCNAEHSPLTLKISGDAK